MKLKFDPSLDYQQQAIRVVVDVLHGQPPALTGFEIANRTTSDLAFTERGLANNIVLDDETLLANVQKVQEANGIPKTGALQGREFSVEMETGTGKTYVYLRTIFELAKTYGLRKFIIVVPSVAIREGVLKSMAMTKDHFRALYDNEPLNGFVYDARKPGDIHWFASSQEIQVMVINIQSFQRDIGDREPAEMTDEDLKKINVIHREQDRLSGCKPIEFIQATRPIVIIDEPQSVDNTERAKRAIAKLKPCLTLRYSATHINPYNLLYQLGPIKAWELRLVKRIEVASVQEEGDFNNAYVKLLQTDNKNGIRAQIELYSQTGGNVKKARLWVKNGDDLYERSGKFESYRDGYIVSGIDCTPGAEFIEFTNGNRLQSDAGINDHGDQIMQEQIRQTIRQHLDKELELKNSGVELKVLSLFFIDRVGNYRIHNDDGTTRPAKIGTWFEQAWQALTREKRYQAFATADIAAIHDGYFSKDKKGRGRDTSGRSKADNDTYNLIMRDKERLLDLGEPLRFIFSHSALREGWDNPNVFQICTLNESNSPVKKRQEIGRGLRLPVNAQGDRVRDEQINRLTVIANESYEQFARSLQDEFEQDCGIRFGRIDELCFAGIIRIKDDNEVPIGQEVSTAIWENLHRAGYIDAEGKILNRFDPENPHFELDIDAQYADIKAAIVDAMRRYLLEGRIVNVRKRKKLTLRKEVYLGEDFRQLWDRIKQRTRYRVAFKTDDLIQQAAGQIRQLEPIRKGRITVNRAHIEVARRGVAANQVAENAQEYDAVTVLPDLLAWLQRETELTRHTLVAILKKSGRLSEFRINPQQFMVLVAQAISRALHGLMIDGIQYEKINGQGWEMCRIEREAQAGIVRYLNNLYTVQQTERCIFDHVEYDSAVEQQFARGLDNHENIRLFVKLPGWFTIDTPIGDYSPDWAFVTCNDEKLYFVCETKGTLDEDQRRANENNKIKCGKRHFEKIGVDYRVVTELSEVDLNQ